MLVSPTSPSWCSTSLLTLARKLHSASLSYSHRQCSSCLSQKLFPLLRLHSLFLAGTNSTTTFLAYKFFRHCNKIYVFHRYILFTMLLVGLCVVITIFVLNIHYRKPSTHKMAPCVRKVFIRCLPKLLLMRVPDQLLADLAAKKRTPWSQNKVPSGGLAITPSAGSSPESLRHFRPNGLYTPTTTNR